MGLMVFKSRASPPYKLVYLTFEALQSARASGKLLYDLPVFKEQVAGEHNGVLAQYFREVPAHRFAG